MMGWILTVRGRHHYVVESNISSRLHHRDAIITFLGIVLNIIEESEAGHASWNGIGDSERIKEPYIN
jgi:hypothetical protein